MDRDKMERAIAEFLEGLGGADLGFAGDDLARTPQRVAQAWCEDLLSGYGADPDGLLSWTPVEPGGGPVVVRDVSFASICIHHLLPFAGRAHIAYLPGARLAGLSKIGRVLEAHARRLQTQEHLTAAVADTLARVLEPRAVLVLVSAGHTCMTLRGVRKERARMVTVEARGLYRDDPGERMTMLSLLRNGAG